MNIVQNKILLQRLAASYGLGTLQGGARRRFEALARSQAPVRQAIREWRERLAGLTELQPVVRPPEVVWRRIELALSLEREEQRLAQARKPTGLARQQQAPSSPWWQRLWVWQGFSAAGLALALLAWVVPWHAGTDSGTQARSAAEAPTSESLALLLDAQNQPAWLASWDGRRQQLQLQDLQGQAVPPGHSLQVWAIPAQGGVRSLAVLDGTSGPQRVAVAADRMDGVTVLAISLEVQGGVPEAGGPKGPVLFKGPWVRKTV
ncbi:anti-sigma factor [Curvibacter sp. RS43]|uniref:anti-sigma factor n=1 Tax=Curvibacter microcysteis TaxID=3026419 RepID=UPI002361BF2B|nr:anti-sigma factor [Curvibacter sp. RS43]MDD0809964.1 anti-sigma factor [Curvibacter sp. RS43]